MNLYTITLAIPRLEKVDKNQLARLLDIEYVARKKDFLEDMSKFKK